MKLNFQKNEIVTGKNPFFVIGSFLLTILFVLTYASDMTVSYRNNAFSILLLSTKKQCSSFLFSRKFVSELKYWQRWKFPLIVT